MRNSSLLGILFRTKLVPLLQNPLAEPSLFIHNSNVLTGFTDYFSFEEFARNVLRLEACIIRKLAREPYDSLNEMRNFLNEK